MKYGLINKSGDLLAEITTTQTTVKVNEVGNWNGRVFNSVGGLAARGIKVDPKAVSIPEEHRVSWEIPFGLKSDDLYCLIEDYNNGLSDKKMLKSIRLAPWLPSQPAFIGIKPNPKHPLGVAGRFNSRNSKQTTLWDVLEAVRNGRTTTTVPERWFMKAIAIKEAKSKVHWATLANNINKWSNGKVKVSAVKLRRDYYDFVGGERLEASMA